MKQSLLKLKIPLKFIEQHQIRYHLLNNNPVLVARAFQYEIKASYLRFHCEKRISRKG